MSPRTLILVPSRYAASLRHAPHSHEELQISFVLRGGLRELGNGTEERADPLSAVVKDPGFVHADDFGHDGAVMAQLFIRGAVFADLLDDPGRAGPWIWRHGGASAAPFLRIVARGRTGQRRFAADDDDVVELLASLSARRADSPPPSCAAPRWLRDAAAHLEEGWRPGLSVRDVARAAGVHPVYLARCLRRWFGVGGADLMRRARLKYAARAIADTSQTMARVAHATGFADEAHLCREFSKATGFTPARFRRLGHEIDHQSRRLADVST
jgi:AraC family transcriptional regulator